MTPELGYHPAHVFSAAALHVAAEQKRNDFLAAMNKQNLMQKESVSPKNADETEKNEEAIKTTKIDGLGVSGELLVRMQRNYVNSFEAWCFINYGPVDIGMKAKAASFPDGFTGNLI